MNISKEAKSFAILGTASNVGKSIVATGLCRVLYQDGFSVAPFKAKNIGLNSGVTKDGGEIGRGQIEQAKAAGIEPTVDMQPILVKPEKGSGQQLIVRGKVAIPEMLEQYRKDRLWSIATESFDKVVSEYEVVVIEGAGSPAEPNLMDLDIANLRIAKYAKASIILVGDIDPGGVFASLEGTVNIIRRHDPEAGDLIKGIIINKFRGVRESLEPALQEFTKVTGIPVLGVIPYMKDHGIADEDTYKLEKRETKKSGVVLDAVVINTPSLQNSDDFDPLVRTPGVQVRFVSNVEDFGEPDIVLLGGSKGTVDDLTWLRVKGFANLIVDRANEGKTVIGICGGFQMLGKKILDPDGIESQHSEVEGLGLLPVVTRFKKGQEKITHQVTGKISQNEGLLKGAKGVEVSGFEIHMARTESADGAQIETVTTSSDYDALGTYFHGIFNNDELRQLMLRNIAKKEGVTLPSEQVMEAGVEYDLLARTIRASVDIGQFYQIVGLRKPLSERERLAEDLAWHTYRLGMMRGF